MNVVDSSCPTTRWGDEAMADDGTRQTRRDETRRDETRRDETRRDETRRDETRRDETRRDETRRDETRRLRLTTVNTQPKKHARIQSERRG